LLIEGNGLVSQARNTGGHFMGIVLWIVAGIALGSIARWVMPGPDPAGPLGAILLSVGSAVVGGTVGTVFGGSSWAGADARSLILAISASLIVMLAYRSYALRWAA
jgi:uncharacterized membrane protein YeaQ/YmgE (transglycosylase-associated protein family)